MLLNPKVIATATHVRLILVLRTLLYTVHQESIRIVIESSHIFGPNVYANAILRIRSYAPATQQARYIKTTSFQRRCDVMTSPRRCHDVVLRLCACWASKHQPFCSPDCIRSTAAKSEISALSRCNLARPTAKSKIGSISTARPPCWICDLWSLIPLWRVRVSASGS